jgi:hypothetical protein
VQGVLIDQEELIERIPTHESGKGQYAGHEARIVPAGDGELVLVDEGGRSRDEGWAGLRLGGGFLFAFAGGGAEAEGFFQGGGGAASEFFEVCYQRIIALGDEGFQVVESDEWRAGFGTALQPQGDGRGAAGGVIQQAFIDVADLLDVERAEGKPASLGWAAAGELGAEDLQGLQKVENDTVVDVRRLGGRGAPLGACGAAFQERVTIWIEERAAVSGQAHGIVLHAAMDGAEGGEKAAPGIRATLQHLLTALVGDFPQLLAQGGDGVVAVVEGLAEPQEAFFFRTEEEHEPHHDGEGGIVDLRLLQACEKGAVGLDVEPVEVTHEKLDGLTHLSAEGVGDFVLVLQTGPQQRGGCVVIGDAEEAMLAEQGLEGAEGDGLLKPEVGKPRGEAGGFVLRREDELPFLAIGDEPEGEVGGMELLHHAGGGRGLPHDTHQRGFQPLLRWINTHEQGRPTRVPIRRRQDGEVGPQRFVERLHACLQPWWQGLPGGDEVRRKAEDALEDILHPGGVRGGGGAAIVLPVGIGGADLADEAWLQVGQAMREGPLHDGQRDEGAGDLDEGKPVGVMAGDAHGRESASGAMMPLASRTSSGGVIPAS